MTRPSLTQLYRRFAGTSVPLSSADADLMRFSRDLEPASAQLSADLAAAFASSSSASSAAHRRAGTPRRAVAASRRWRGVAALAASLIAAVAVWSTHRTGTIGDMPTAQNVRVPSTSTPATDRIFAAFDDHAMASRAKPAGDEIFRGQFLQDEIFNSKMHDG